ncbi:hypothetical protein NW767_012510 [Fusarium falciforme]|nr:hypothetical protein NW767_012510 [Fusarium falciforme]
MATLGHLISKGEKDFKQKVAAFGAVVNIPEHENGSLTLIHFSFNEFLLSEQCPSEFRVCPEEVHEMMLIKCIDLMKDGLCQDTCSLQHPGGLVEDLAPATADSRIPQHLQYSCHHWINHLENMVEERRNSFLGEAGTQPDEADACGNPGDESAQ